MIQHVCIGQFVDFVLSYNTLVRDWKSNQKKIARAVIAIILSVEFNSALVLTHLYLGKCVQNN